MARASLIFRYQWRAFWRRVLRTGRVKFYLSVLTLLGWMTAVALPDSLSRAAGELAAGQMASMDRLLLVLCLLWLVVLGEDLNVSVSNVPITVQAPISVAAVVCQVTVAVLANAINRGGASCYAQSTSAALNKIVQNVINAQHQ